VSAQPAGTARLLSIAKAAEHARCHPETIRRAIRTGELPATRNRLAQGCPLLIADSDLREFIAKRMGAAN
jgi:hypothetical protein